VSVAEVELQGVCRLRRHLRCGFAVCARYRAMAVPGGLLFSPIARNLFFHHFRILVALGPGKEEVQSGSGGSDENRSRRSLL